MPSSSTPASLGAVVPATLQAPSLVADLAAFRKRHAEGGLREGLRFLNARTSHRYTGVFRFDGEILRSVGMVDKWDTTVESGLDVPLATAYCAHLRQTGEPLLIEDGARDPRVPWMAGGPIASYCGALIRDGGGEPWGALCHFDEQPCEAKNSDMPLIAAAAAAFHESAVAATLPLSGT